MIHVFSKFAAVIPLKEKDAVHLMPAINKAFTRISIQREILHTDDEGALTNKWVAGKFERAGTQHIATTSSAHFVERFNRTFKNMISQRMIKLERGFRLTSKQAPIDKTKYQWSDLIPNVMSEYNNKNRHRQA